MPYDEPDATDSKMLVGVELPGTEESTRDMAHVSPKNLREWGLAKTS